MALKVASCTKNAPDGLSDAPGQHRNSSHSVNLCKTACVPTCRSSDNQPHLCVAANQILHIVALVVGRADDGSSLQLLCHVADVLAHSVCTQSQEAGGYTLDAKSSSEANACCSGSDTQTWVVTAFLHVNLVLSLQHDRDRQ